MARQVFSEDNPSVTVPVSEANATEDPLAASAGATQEEEHVTTPSATQEEVHEENQSMP